MKIESKSREILTFAPKPKKIEVKHLLEARSFFLEEKESLCFK